MPANQFWTDASFFDLISPEHLFDALERTLRRYGEREAKAIEDVLFLILGLAHLREWIAPEFKGQHEPTNTAERFSAALFKLPAFKVILDLANHAKHQGERPLRVHRVDYSGVPIDDWPDVDSVMSFDDGPATGYYVDDQDISDLFTEVLSFYRERWFSLTLAQRLDGGDRRASPSSA